MSAETLRKADLLNRIGGAETVTVARLILGGDS